MSYYVFSDIRDPVEGSGSGVEWKLLRSRAYSKNKKPIQQLQVVPKLSLLIVLTNDQVRVGQQFLKELTDLKPRQFEFAKMANNNRVIIGKLVLFWSYSKLEESAHLRFSVFPLIYISQALNSFACPNNVKRHF